MKSILTTLDLINQPKPADVIAEDEVEEELTLEELEALEEDDDLEEATMDDWYKAGGWKRTSRSQEKTPHGTLRKSTYVQDDEVLVYEYDENGEVTVFKMPESEVDEWINENPESRGLAESVEVEEGLTKDGKPYPSAEKQVAKTKKEGPYTELEPRIENEPRKGIYGTKKFVKDDENLQERIQDGVFPNELDQLPPQKKFLKYDRQVDRLAQNPKNIQRAKDFEELKDVGFNAHNINNKYDNEGKPLMNRTMNARWDNAEKIDANREHVRDMMDQGKSGEEIAKTMPHKRKDQIGKPYRGVGTEYAESAELSRIAKLAGLEEGWWPWSDNEEEKEEKKDTPVTTKPGKGLFGGYKTRQEQLDAMEKAAMGEGHDMVPYADPELDFEGDMAKNQLARIMLHAEHLSSMLEDNENMPEWVQSKITKALDYISTAHDYLMGEEYKD